jgi:chloramphenicol 3-O-phosphotransferase
LTPAPEARRCTVVTVPTQSVLIVTGPPGAGKSTVSRLVAGRHEQGVCIESDWFWSTIVNGFISPWESGSDHQNRIVLRSFVAATSAFAQGGYPVVLDAVVGPWYLDLVTEELQGTEVDVHYVVLRPSLPVVLARATGRSKMEERAPGHGHLVDEDPIRSMWERFSNLGGHERFVIDTSDLDPEQTAALVWERFRAGDFRL